MLDLARLIEAIGDESQIQVEENPTVGVAISNVCWAIAKRLEGGEFDVTDRTSPDA